MKKLIQKRSIQILLGSIVIMIWGYNIIFIFDISTMPDNGSETAIVNIENELLDIPQRREYSYQSTFPDPFKPEFLVLKKEKNTPSEEKPKKRIIPPRLKLFGVIEQTAQLKTMSNEVQFVSKGDSVEGAIVRSITPDSVVLSYKSKIFTVKL